MLNNPIGSLRHIAAEILGDDGNITPGWMSKDTLTELAEAEKAYGAWYERTFGDTDFEKANEAFDAIVGLQNATRQLAFEDGMKAGVRLMAELLGR